MSSEFKLFRLFIASVISNEVMGSRKKEFNIIRTLLIRSS